MLLDAAEHSSATNGWCKTKSFKRLLTTLIDLLCSRAEVKVALLACQEASFLHCYIHTLCSACATNRVDWIMLIVKCFDDSLHA